MTICVIPARGGSKRIPRKNIREFLGRPIINWSIKAAQDAACFERIVVSTDDEEVAEVARAAGAEVPFSRISSLSDDSAPIRPVIADAADQLGIPSATPVCCLFATAPFVLSVDLTRGLEFLEKEGVRFVISVTTFPFPIQRALRRKENGRVEMIEPQFTLTRSQDFEEMWHDAGQFYWASAEAWQDPHAEIFSAKAYGLALPRYRVQDIDTEEDWIRAERLMSAIILGGEKERNERHC